MVGLSLSWEGGFEEGAVLVSQLNYCDSPL